MLRISRKGEEIILRDIDFGEFVPMILIISATLFFLFFGINDPSMNFLFYIAALVLLIVCIYNLSFIQIKTVKINKQKRILSINNRSLIKNMSYVYRFGEISNLIFVDTFTGKNGDKSHRLYLSLETGERIELARATADKDTYFEAARFINHVIFDNPKKIPAKFQRL